MWWKLIGGWVFSCFGDSKKEGTRKVPPLGRHRALETRGAVVPFLRRRYVVSRWKGELFADGGADGVSPSSPTCLDALWRILIWTGRRGGGAEPSSSPSCFRCRFSPSLEGKRRNSELQERA